MKYNEDTSNSVQHVENMQHRFQECVDHMRLDIGKIDDVKCKAMFETAAEVLEGLIKAFDHYKNKSEAAWQ